MFHSVGLRAVKPCGPCLVKTKVAFTRSIACYSKPTALKQARNTRDAIRHEINPCCGSGQVPPGFQCFSFIVAGLAWISSQGPESSGYPPHPPALPENLKDLGPEAWIQEGGDFERWTLCGTARRKAPGKGCGLRGVHYLLLYIPLSLCKGRYLFFALCSDSRWKK